MRDDLRIGVDLGGTKIEAVAMAPSGEILARTRTSTPRDYAALVHAVAHAAQTVAVDGGAVSVTRTRVGVCTPGSISPRTGLMRNSNSTWVNGMPMERDLAEALDAPLRMANDANCFALSEAADGAGAGARSVFGIIIGTGVGGGLVFEGRLIEGANGVAGEWGHAALPLATAEEAAISCWCGRQACLECFLCGPALAADYKRETGADASAEEVAKRSAAGETEAAAAFARYADRLGRALGMIVNVFDPDIVVLGGGLSNVSGLPEIAEKAMRRHVFSDYMATRVVKNRHGDSSGVRGAAWLWPAEGKL